MQRPVLVIAGATASGKSAVALELALRLNGEIVSVDSMQVYRGMDIGTAKPSLADQQRVPHHMLDVFSLRDECDAATFATLARRAIGDIHQRGKLPLLCGGTGFYLKATLEGVVPNPARDWQLRAELEQTPLPALLQELAAADPAAYERVDRENPRRVIRAVEILRLRQAGLGPTNDPHESEPKPLIPWAGMSLARAVDDLRARIETRVDLMFQEGLVEETRRLLTEGLAENRIATQALGYKQVLEHLRGEGDLPQTIELVKARTRQYARRQRTWFRNQIRLANLTVSADESPAALAARIEAFFREARVLL